MEPGETLTGLDDIDWAGLEHAYGSAHDVPTLIRGLLAESREVRDDVMQCLYSNIFHQGTRYEATAYAVPFLARLAVHPDTPWRSEIVDLLGSITVGFDEVHLPRGIDIATQRAELALIRIADPTRRELAIDAWIEAAPDASERRRRGSRRLFHEAADELSVSAMEDTVHAYDAVLAQIPDLRTLLNADDPETRAATAYLLSWFPEQAHASLDALASLSAAEKVPAVAATAIVAIGLLSGRDLVPMLREHLAGPEPLPRWAAAIALARLGAADTAVIGVLAATSAQPPEPDSDGSPGIRFLDGDLGGYASQTLAAMQDALPPEAFDAVLDGLARSTETGAFAIASAALRLAFPEGPVDPFPAFEGLTGPQQRLVRVLAEADSATWRWANFTQILRAWRLPGRQAELRAYASLDPVG
jgi:hypothetical protein